MEFNDLADVDDAVTECGQWDNNIIDQTKTSYEDEETCILPLNETNKQAFSAVET